MAAVSLRFPKCSSVFSCISQNEVVSGLFVSPGLNDSFCFQRVAQPATATLLKAADKLADPQTDLPAASSLSQDS